MLTRNIFGERIINAGKIVTKKPTKKYEPQFEASKIKLKRLISEHLCEGKNSNCVKTGNCECLDACAYGQAYINKANET